jgi:hypothetical protein
MKEHFFSRALTSLFIRLFLWFFAVSALVLIATFYITQRAEVPDDIVMNNAPQIAQDLLRAQSDGGVIALDQAHDRIRKTLRINAYLTGSGKKTWYPANATPVTRAAWRTPDGTRSTLQIW